jgi:hypothetical protein
LDLSFNYLTDIKDSLDLENSQRWFREPGSLQKRKVLIQSGFNEFPNDQLDSVLVANYIKHLIKNIRFGLIPECIQLMMMELIPNPPSKVWLIQI